MSSLFSLIPIVLSAVPYGDHRTHTPSCTCIAREAPLNDCEGYDPAWYDMWCDCGISLSAEFLYWYGKECNLPYAEKFKNIQLREGGITPITLAAPRNQAYTKASWAPGARAGIGWNMPCDGWELNFLWTGYWNKKAQKETTEEFNTAIPEIDSSGLLGVWLYPSGVGTGPDIFDRIKATWHFKFSRFTLSMGRRYYVSRFFLLRPYAGLDAIWTNTHFTTIYANREIEDEGRAFSGKVHAKNKNWGIGFVGGLEPTWKFNPCFSLVSNFAFSLTWGGNKQVEKTNYQNLITESPGDSLIYSNKQSQSGYCMFPLLDLGVALRWDTYFCHRQYHLALDLGWEHHILFDHNIRSIVGDVFSANDLSFFPGRSSFMSNNVAMGGLVLKGRFDF